jgi:putative transposase
MEMRPMLENAAAEPADYRWSSYAHHAGIQTDPMLTDHPQYWQLGNTPFEREAAYRQGMERGMSRAEIDRIGVAVRGGWPLGSKEFKQELEKRTQRRISPGRRGRPPASSSLPFRKANKPGN